MPSFPHWRKTLSSKKQAPVSQGSWNSEAVEFRIVRHFRKLYTICSILTSPICIFFSPQIPCFPFPFCNRADPLQWFQGLVTKNLEVPIVRKSDRTQFLVENAQRKARNTGSNTFCIGSYWQIVVGSDCMIQSYSIKGCIMHPSHASHATHRRNVQRRSA